jgi:hypothetical protein
MTKAKIRLLQILWVLHFIAATIEKQQDLGDNWQINVHKNFIVLKTALPLFPRPMKTLLALRMTKAKIRLCKFFGVCIYSHHNWQTTIWRQLTNKCSKNFILYWKQLSIISRPMKHCWALRMTKLKFDFAILWVLHL